MIFIIFILIGLFLSVFAFFLLKKQTIFLALLAADHESNKQFLARYGFLFLCLALLAFGLSPFIQRDGVLYFIALMMLVSGLFSYQFSKKIK